MERKVKRVKLSRAFRRKRLAMAAAMTGILLVGGVLSAPSAQAAIGGGGCRLKGWAGSVPGVLLLPCSMVGAEGTIMGQINVQNPNGLFIDSCAQLLRVNNDGSTSLDTDYGCHLYADNKFTWFTDGVYPTPYYGTYVVQTGFWYNGNYYGGAQSARITIY